MRHAKLRVSFKHLTEVLGLPKDAQIHTVHPYDNCPSGSVDFYVSGPGFMDRPIADPAIIDWPIKAGDRPEDW